MSNYTVYMHTCPNGKRYIGITCQYPPEKRWKSKGDGYRSQTHFYRAIKKYGWENIEHKILANWLTIEKAEKLERECIEYYKTNDSLYGYNKTSGGESGKVLSKESIIKLKEKLKGRKGRTLSEEQKKKLIESKLGKKLSDETKIKISEKLKGRKRTEDEIINQIKFSPRGSEHHASRSVTQYSLDGEFIRKWETITEVKNNLRKNKISNIGSCLAKKTKKAYGYKWEYAEEQT